MKGTHGTCGSHARDIQNHGFKKAETGLAGSGIYFWAVYDVVLLDYAISLAKAWWKHKKDKGYYEKCDDNQCTVISANLKIKNGLFLDLESHEMKSRTIAWINYTHSQVQQSARGKKALSKIYDLYISMLEEEAKMKADIVYVTVRTPPSFDYPDIDFSIRGLPGCYVVKNKSCIEELSFEKF